MIYKMKIDNLIAEKGYTLGIKKEIAETNENFFRRIQLAMNFINKKRDTVSALGFCTKNIEQNLCEITQFVERYDPPRIRFNLLNVQVWRKSSLSLDSNPDYSIEYKNVKFLIDFIEWLESLETDDGFPLFNIKMMQFDDSWKFLHTSKIIKIDTLIFKEAYPLMNYHSQQLPHDYIFDLFFNNSSKEYINVPVASLNNDSKYYFDNITSTLVRYYNDPIEDVNYFYCDYPVILKLNAFEIINYENKQFDEIVLDKVKYDSSTLEHKRLNQTGAKYYNELLKLSNSYWGK